MDESDEFDWQLEQLAGSTGSMLFCFGVVGMELGFQIQSNSHVPFCLPKLAAEYDR